MRVLLFTHMYPCSGHPARGIFVQQQVASLRREGIEIDVLCVDTRWSRLVYFWSFAPLLFRAYSTRYDLVHAHYVFAGLVARSQLRFPLVVTHHGDEAFHGWQAPLCRLVSQLASHTIAVSQQILSAVHPPKGVVIPCGVDFQLFRPLPQQEARQALGLPRSSKLVLFAGDYLKKLKRFDLVTQAVATLRAQDDDVRLLVASNQPYERLPLYMNASDLLILASDREGSPQVVKEAMACNLPVVTVNVGDAPEVLSGVAHCYVCERHPEALAAAMRQVLKERARTNGRERTLRYEIQAIARQVKEVYSRVLASSQHRDVEPRTPATERSGTGREQSPLGKHLTDFEADSNAPTTSDVPHPWGGST